MCLELAKERACGDEMVQRGARFLDQAIRIEESGDVRKAEYVKGRGMQCADEACRYYRRAGQIVSKETGVRALRATVDEVGKAMGRMGIC